MNMTYEEAIALLNIDSPNEEIDEFKVCCANTIAELEDIIEAEDAGEMAEEEADTAIAEILEEHEAKALDIFDLQIVEEYAANSSNIASFSEGLGSVLSGLIAAEYENPLDGIADLVEATGSDEDTIQAIVLGDAVPDLTMGEQIASVFDSLSNDDSAYKEWNGLVSRAYGEAVGDLNIPQVENPETEAALATMAANQNTLLAEFSQMKSQAELAEELRVLDAQAQELVEQGILTPFERKDLLGEFSDREDAIALFSEACEAMAIPPQIQLYGAKFYLHMRQRCGSATAMFSQMSDGDSVAPYSLSEQDQGFIKEMLDETIG